MPTRAQDRAGSGPFAALLILLSLVLGSANAAASSAGTNGPATRLAPAPHNSAAALLPSGTRNPLEDEADGARGGPSLLPSRPGIVTERLPARPRAEAPVRVPAAVPRPAIAAYRARAPPAA